jgi:hypothetical protein
MSGTWPKGWGDDAVDRENELPRRCDAEMKRMIDD